MESSKFRLQHQIEKIQEYPLKDTYEIQKVSTPVKKEIKPLKSFENFIQDGYKLINKTKNKVVLDQTSKRPLRKNCSIEAEQADFISSIAKNLRKFARLEKLK